MARRRSPRHFPLCFTLILSASPGALLADGGANHRIRNMHFGVSGGNVQDISQFYCCSGTLGSLLQDSDAALYILSNNHVLGRSGKAVAGEDVSQPGMVDAQCKAKTRVADFTVAAALRTSNVDAAIARLRTGMMDSTGFIEDIGTISSLVETPLVGVGVAKSGRTTGFTIGTIGSIDTTVSVRYQRKCGMGRKFIVTYLNQVVINQSGFSAGGDSGSLIVTNDSCHQPVALLFAGSSTSTIGNPIGEVLAKLSSALGKTLTFVGGSCVAPASARSQMMPAARFVEAARLVKERHAQELMTQPGVIGVGVGASEVMSPEAALVVYVDKTAPEKAILPREIDGVQLRAISTDPFVAY